MIAIRTITAAALLGLAVAVGGCTKGQSLGSTVTALTGSSMAGNLTDAGVKGAEALTLSADQEDAMGQAVGLRLTNEYGVDPDLTVQKYVSLVGTTLADQSARPEANWLFVVLDTDTANAYAGPNGYVFITRGLLNQMQDEAELAGVLAHEIAHVVKKHGFGAVKRAKGAAAVSQAAGEVGLGGLLGDTTDAVVANGYDKPTELEADYEGVLLMTAVGYDARSYLAFLKRMEADTSGTLMSTHPDKADRVERVRGHVSTVAKPGKATLKERFEKYARQPPAASTRSGEELLVAE